MELSEYSFIFYRSKHNVDLKGSTFEFKCKPILLRYLTNRNFKDDKISVSKGFPDKFHLSLKGNKDCVFLELNTITKLSFVT